MAVDCQGIVEEVDRVLARVAEVDVAGTRRMRLESRFMQLIHGARITAGPGAGDSPLRDLCREAAFAKQDLFNLFNIVHRVHWMRSKVLDATMPEDLFYQFAGADIDMFHVELRSIFDYLAHAMSPFAHAPLPDSFNKLRARIAGGEGYSAKIGQAIANLVTSCSWFGYLKDSRDCLIHDGDFTLVFPHASRVLFQTYEPEGIRVHFPPVMFTERIVDFEIYAGMWLARLYDYLERWANAMFQITGVPPYGQPVLCSDGVPIAVEWMRKARSAFYDFADRSARAAD